MASLQGLTHYGDVAGAVERIIGAADLVAAAFCHVDEMGNQIAARFLRIDELRHPETLAPSLFLNIDVDTDDHVGAGQPQALDDVESNAAEPEYDTLGAGLDFRGVQDRTDAGGDAAADVTDL